MANHKLFVYGTLKSGHGNCRHFLVGGKARLLGQAITVDKFLLMDFGGCPGMYDADRKDTKKNPAIQQIMGELWECDDTTRASIDRLEGHPHGWKRTPIKVHSTQDDPCPDIECETYIYQGGLHGQPCTDGIWPRK